jgi:hypothetical protein
MCDKVMMLSDEMSGNEEYDTKRSTNPEIVASSDEEPAAESAQPAD